MAVLGAAVFAFVAPPAIFRLDARLCATACGCGLVVARAWVAAPTAGRTDGVPNDFDASVEPALLPVLAQGLFAVVLVLVAARVIRGRRAPLSLAAVVALAPLALALGQIWVRERDMGWILAGTSPHLIDMLRHSGTFGDFVHAIAGLLVDGVDFFQMGAIGAAAAMLAVAVAGAATLFTVDATRIGPPPSWAVFRGARSDSLPTTRSAEVRLRWITVAAGLLGLTVSAVARVVLRPQWVGVDVLAFAVLLLAVPIAVTASAPLPALVAHRDPGEAGKAFRTFALCAFAVAAAMLLLEASALALELRAFVASTSPSCLARGWAMASPPFAWSTPFEPGARARLVVVDTVAGLAAFAPALIASARVRAKLSWGGVALAAVVATLGLLGARVATRTVADLATLQEPYAIGAQALAQAGIALPVSAGADRATAEPIRWIATAEGLVDPWALVPPSRRLRAYPLLEQLDGAEGHGDTVAADAALPAARLASDLLAARPRRWAGGRPIHLVAARSWRLPVERFGALAALRSTDLGSHGATLAESVADLPPPGARQAGWIGILPDGDHARVVAFQGTAPGEIAVTELYPPLDLHGVRDPAGAWSRDRVVVAPPAEMTVAGLISLLDLLGHDGGNAILTPDRATLEEALDRWTTEHAARAARHGINRDPPDP